MPIDVADLCETLSTFAPEESYENFRTEIKSLYPGAEDDNRFVEGDLSATVAAFKATTGGTRYTKENIGEYSLAGRNTRSAP